MAFSLPFHVMGEKVKRCPCGARLSYEGCCGRYIDDGELPETPLALMKSRYTAYTRANVGYIEQTQRGEAAQGFDAVEAKNWALSVEWLGLKVLKASRPEGNHGTVEFEARFRHDGGVTKMHEHSEFECRDGRWFYVGALPLK